MLADDFLNGRTFCSHYPHGCALSKRACMLRYIYANRIKCKGIFKNTKNPLNPLAEYNFAPCQGCPEGAEIYREYQIIGGWDEK